MIKKINYRKLKIKTNVNIKSIVKLPKLIFQQIIQVIY